MMIGYKPDIGFGKENRSLAMRSIRNSAVAVAAVVFAAMSLLPADAKAISVDVAKKCNALMAKEITPRQAGNPAAGSEKGNGQASRDYFKKCVDKGGNVESSTDKK